MNPNTSLQDPSILDFSEVRAILQADIEKGLSAQEAAERLRRFGPNQLVSAPPLPAWRKLLAQFQDPLIYLLLIAIVVSAIAWWTEGAHGTPVDTLVILVIVIANAILGYLQEAKAENAVAALASMTTVTSSVLRAGQIERIPSSQLVPGDLLLLGEGDSVGADARLFQAINLRVAEASLTGESTAVHKDTARLSETSPLGDRHNMVFKGTAVAQGVARALVTATGMQTEMGRIARLLEATKEDPTPLQKEIHRLGRLLGIAVVVICLIVVATILGVFGIHTIQDAIPVLLLGVSLAVAAVPEGLPAILSVVLAIGVQRMAERKAIVKKLSSVETLGSASVICSDKTGTLTKNEMTLVRVLTASGEVTLTGVGYHPEGAAQSEDQALVDPALIEETRLALRFGSLAGNADFRQREGQWEIQGDPTEAAFLVATHKLEGAQAGRDAFKRLGEVPFTSERKRMSTLQHHPESDRRLLVSKGAPDVLLSCCSKVQVGDTVLPLDDARRGQALADVEKLSSMALRTLGVAYRWMEEHPLSETLDETSENDLIYVGVVGIIDPPRPEAKTAVADAHRAGIRVLMITGDHPLPAGRIATDLGIIPPGAKVLSGLQIDGLDERALRATVRDVSVFARVAPEHKLRIVDALQAEGHIVAMTGDGVNDAPALKTADIGVAMGITGTEVTKEAGKMILADDNFATIVAAVREGRRIFDNIKKFLRFLLSSNMGEVLTVFLGVVFAKLLGLSGANDSLVLPLLATQILWINLVTDSGPALAMGVDPETDDVMGRPPRRLTDNVIDRRMWSGVLLIGLGMAAATLGTIDLFLPGGFFEGGHSLEAARTAGFTTLVFAQLLNALNSRSEITSAFHRLFANAWLWGAIALGRVLQIAVGQIPFLNRAFNTVPMTLEDWGICVLMASTVVWLAEIRKWVLRRPQRPSSAVPGVRPLNT